MTGAESKPVSTYTLADLVEDPATFTAHRHPNQITPAPNSCAACGEDPRNHALEWVTRRDGTSEYHHYEAPTDRLRLNRMLAARSHRA